MPTPTTIIECPVCHKPYLPTDFPPNCSECISCYARRPFNEGLTREQLYTKALGSRYLRSMANKARKGQLPPGQQERRELHLTRTGLQQLASGFSQKHLAKLDTLACELCTLVFPATDAGIVSIKKQAGEIKDYVVCPGCLKEHEDVG